MATAQTDYRPAVSNNLDRKRKHVAVVDTKDSKKERIENEASHNIQEDDSEVSLAPTVDNIPTEMLSLNWHDYQDSSESSDSDRFYLKSLLHYFEMLDTSRKLIVRAKIDKIFEQVLSM